jgi:hypothetical protein
VAVDDEAVVEGPAGPGQGLDPLELALGHAGVVLEGHRQDRLAAVGVADEPGEARDGADVGAPGGEAGELEARLERFKLDPDHGLAAGDGGEERHLAGARERGRGLGVGLVDGTADNALAGGRLGEAGVALPQMSHEVGHGLDARRQVQFFLRTAGALLEPGEIADAHQELPSWKWS